MRYFKCLLIVQLLIFSQIGISYAQFEKGILMEGVLTTNPFHKTKEFQYLGGTVGAFSRYLFVGQIPTNALFIEANVGLSRLVGLPILDWDCSKRNQYGECYHISVGNQIDYLILISLSAGAKTNIRNLPLQASMGVELSHFPDLWRHADGKYGGRQRIYIYNPNAWNLLMNIGIPFNNIKFLDSIMFTYKHPKSLHTQHGFRPRRQLGLTLKIKL